MHSLKATRTFERSFRSLDSVHRVRVDNAVTRLEDNPRLGKPLRGLCLRARIYVVDDEGSSVVPLDVRHRRWVCR